MNEKKDFALVPTPPGALEKTEPGAKRILSGMVSDALALVRRETPRRTRPPRIVILDDQEGFRHIYSLELKSWYDGAEVLAFGRASDAWQELSRTDPDLFITDIHHAGMSCPDMLDRLSYRKINYPILVISASYELYGDAFFLPWKPNLNVSFLPKPCSFEDFRAGVEAALQIPARRTP